MSFEKAYEEYLEYASNRHKKQGFDTIVKNFKLHILPSKLYTVDSVVDDSLILWLDAKGKLNSAVDKTEWIDKANNSKLGTKPKVKPQIISQYLGIYNL